MGKRSPTVQRILGIQVLLEFLLRAREVSARSILEILGHMASLIDLVPLNRLNMRSLQVCLLRQWKPKRDKILKLILISENARTDLNW
jgi:hypothetical protein